MVHEFEKPLIW